MIHGSKHSENWGSNPHPHGFGRMPAATGRFGDYASDQEHFKDASLCQHKDQYEINQTFLVPI